MLFGMCKSQYDIEVEQQRTRIERKKGRDTMKQLHAHFGFQPPRSPISPTPPEVEIPSFDQRMRTMINSNMINEYGSMFFESGEGSSSSAAPPPPPSSEEVPQPYGVPQGPAAYLHPSAPQLPHLHLWKLQRRQRHLRIGRVAFLLGSLVGLDIHLLIRVWMTIFMFISIFSPYLVYLSYIISFPDSYIGGSSHPGGPVWDSWQGQ
jgi:hypothetical protein